MGTVPDTRAKAHGPRLPTHAFSCAAEKGQRQERLVRDSRANERAIRAKRAVVCGTGGELASAKNSAKVDFSQSRERALFHAPTFAPSRAIRK